MRLKFIYIFLFVFASISYGDHQLSYSFDKLPICIEFNSRQEAKQGNYHFHLVIFEFDGPTHLVPFLKGDTYSITSNSHIYTNFLYYEDGFYYGLITRAYTTKFPKGGIDFRVDSVCKFAFDLNKGVFKLNFFEGYTDAFDVKLVDSRDKIIKFYPQGVK